MECGALRVGMRCCVAGMGCFLLMVMAVGCNRGGEPEVSSRERPVVFTTFYPTQYFAQRIGRDHVEVVCPVPEDADAIFWMPEDSAILAYQQADLIILNGAGFSKWVGTVSLPEDRVVDTARPFADAFIAFENVAVHSHGPTGEHAHEGIDGHTWVDPINAITQAGEIRKAFVSRWPEHAEDFDSGHAALVADMRALEGDLAVWQQKAGSQPLFASQPAYNYIARRYSWNIENLDLDPEQILNDEDVSGIRERLTQHPAKVLIWESEPVPENTKRLAKELGLKSVVFSPCELLGAEQQARGEDYMSVMKQNLVRLSAVFSGDDSL